MDCIIEILDSGEYVDSSDVQWKFDQELELWIEKRKGTISILKPLRIKDSNEMRSFVESNCTS